MAAAITSLPLWRALTRKTLPSKLSDYLAPAGAGAGVTRTPW